MPNIEAMSLALNNRVGVYDILTYGSNASPGVTDMTSAVQACYTAAPAGSTVFWPGGQTYLITGQINLRKHNITTVFGGGGEDSGVNAGTSNGDGCCILHIPTAAGTLFDIATATPSSTQLNNPTFEGSVLVYSTDTTYSKTAFKFSNVSRPVFNGRISVAGATGAGSFYRGNSGGDGGSVGVYILGREQVNLGDVSLYAQVPLRFGANPDGSGYDMDHVHVGDAILSAGTSNAPSTLIHSCVLIDNNVRMSVVTFDGYMALVGGKHKVYWKPTSNLTSSTRLTLKNAVTEQGTDSTAYSIHIEIPDGSAEVLQNLTVENTSLGPDQYGVYTKNVNHVFLRGVSGTHTTGAKLLKCEGAHSSGGTLSVGWDDLRIQATAPASLIELPSDMVLSYASQTAYGDSRHHPGSARYTKAYAYGTVTQRPFMRSGMVDSWNWYTTIADGVSVTLPITERYLGTQLALINVLAVSDSAAGTLNRSGVFVAAPNAMGTNGVDLVTVSHADVVAASPTVGQLGLYGVVGTTELDYVILRNRCGETLRVLITVEEYRNQAN